MSTFSTVDQLAKMLRQSKGPPIEELLNSCPDQPLGPPEGRIMVQKRGVGWIEGKRQKHRKSTLALRKRYPGYQSGYKVREEMKYGNMPNEGDPLREYVRARISHAKALWSRDLDTRETRLQFVDWLRDHVNGKTWIAPLWPFEPGFYEALQIIRLAYGLSRYPPPHVIRRWKDG